jgi:hypothetical protein
MTRGERWSDLRWALSWAISPAPLSWLILGVLLASIVHGVLGIVDHIHLVSERRQLRQVRDSLVALGGRGLRVTLSDGTVTWFTAASPDTAGRDTVRYRTPVP